MTAIYKRLQDLEGKIERGEIVLKSAAPPDYLQQIEDLSHKADDILTILQSNAKNVAAQKQQKSKSAPQKAADGAAKVACVGVMQLYCEICPDMPKPANPTDCRIKKVKARMDEGAREDDFKEVFAKIAASDFLSGRKTSKDHPNFKATFDWILEPRNWTKVAEGNYDDNTKDAHSYDLDRFDKLAINV